MVTAQATPTDVRGIIDTDLSDSEISNFIDDAVFEADKAIERYAERYTDTHRQQLEKYLSALKIRLYKDRSASNVSRETASVTYEGTQINQLRQEVERRDPSGTLAYQTDSDRYVGST